MGRNRIAVEVIYPASEGLIWMSLLVKTGSTIAQAIKLSKITVEKDAVVGIWGSKQPMDYVVEAGDRIEIYQPLLMDPKTRRQKRAKQEAIQLQQQKRLEKQARHQITVIHPA